MGIKWLLTLDTMAIPTHAIMRKYLLLCPWYNGESTGEPSKPNPQTTAESVVGNSGFPLSLLEVLPTLKGQLLGRLKVALLERSHNALFLRKLPFLDSCVCSYFPTASLKNPGVSNPSKRRQ